MRIFGRSSVPAEVLSRAGLPPGERVLASGDAPDGTWVLGTRRLLVIVPPAGSDEPLHLPWEEVEGASWDRDDERLQVTALGEFGRPRPAYTLTMAEPAGLLQLVRERVTASIVLQRRVTVRDRRGLTVIARRSPAGGPISWMHAYDDGLDPADPEVARLADLALERARSEVGEPI